MGCYDTTISRAVEQSSYGRIDSQKFLANPSTFLGMDYSSCNSSLEGYDSTMFRAVTEGSYG